MITLTHNSTEYLLPYDLDWTDRNWSPVSQAITTGLTGAPIVQQGVRAAGRTISLQSPPRGGWMRYEDARALRDLAQTLTGEMTLEFKGESHTVLFRHDSQPPVQYSPIRYLAELAPDDPVTVQIRLITV